MTTSKRPNEKVTVVRATAIAAVNAAMVHLKLGLFLSEYTLAFEDCRDADGHIVLRNARTNTGLRIATVNSFVYKKRDYDENDPFPIEKVLVDVYGPPASPDVDTPLLGSCECLFLASDKIMTYDYDTVD